MLALIFAIQTLCLVLVLREQKAGALGCLDLPATITVLRSES